MKQFTEAQVMAFRDSILPPTRRSYDVVREPTAAEKRSAKRCLATRRAIEAYQEARAIRIEMEL